MQTPPLSTSAAQSRQAASPAGTASLEEPTRTPPHGAQAASGMSGLEARISRSPGPRSNRASLPAAPGRASASNVRESANFFVGIKEEPNKSEAFGLAARGGHLASLKYIADNVNPNLGYGSALNFGKALIGSGPLVLKQNCVYCSTAADQNLEALASAHPASFWIADKTSAGTLPPQGSLDRSVRKEDKISDLLAADIARGRRGIISVPQKNTPAYSHAMNCVHAEDGSLHIIDGQNSRIYDLTLEADRKSFDDKFGYNGGPCVARFFTTGAAPCPPKGDDQGDWVHVA